MVNFRSVNQEDWIISDNIGIRKYNLINFDSPKKLIETVRSETELARDENKIKVNWQPSCERRGFGRLVAQIPLSEITFDQLFNGRAGYRAQFYLSPDEGVLFNRALIDSISNVLFSEANKINSIVDRESVWISLMSPHSKIWCFNEKEAFDEAMEDILNPQRWVNNGAKRGRKAPLPSHCMIDIKGTFINPKSGDIFIDEYKLERSLDIHRCGYS